MVASLVVAGAIAFGFWQAESAAGGNGASAATTVNAGATPTAVATGQSVAVNWAATTLASGTAVGGYLVKRYDAGTLTLQTILSGCAGTVTATTCTENSVPAGTWKYSVTPVFGTNWQGTESAKSTSVVVTAGADSTPPTSAITLSGVTGGASKSGDTIYYRGTDAGSFTLTDTVTDGGSGPASSQTAALGGTTDGWSHTDSTVTTPSQGPYVSNPFSWTASTSSAPTEAVTARDVAGNATVTNLSFVDDSTAPTAGTITYTDGYLPGMSVPVTFTTGTDTGGSGIATRQLQRQSAPLTAANTCVTGPASPTSAPSTRPRSTPTPRWRTAPATSTGTSSPTPSATSTRRPAPTWPRSTTKAPSTTPAALLSLWRLGEASGGGTTTVDSDTFTTGSAGTAITARSPDVGTWTHKSGSTTEVLSNAGRARRNGTGQSIDYMSPGPTNADYSVSADIYRAGALTGDRVAHLRPLQRRR